MAQLRLRTASPLVVVCLVLSALIPAIPASSAELLTVVSWGGAYTNSQVEAYMKPFTEKTGVRFNVVDYNGGLDQVARQVESGEVLWDVVDVELSDAIRGCDAGLFETIPHDVLPPGADGQPIYEDFLPHALQDCAVGEVVWATVYAYDVNRFPGDKPRTIAHFFDVERFPGMRGLRKSPRVNIEWALMADGVAPDKVYEELAKPGGVARAFKVLDRIRDHVVWWEVGSDPPKMLAAGDVVMTSAYNGRLYDPIVKQGRPYIIVWDGQIWDFDLWAIVKGTRNLKTALDFVAFSTDTQRLADQAEYISYGPARRSSMALISPEMKWQLPTSEDNSQTAVQNDFDWWSDNQDRMDRRFEEWLSGN